MKPDISIPRALPRAHVRISTDAQPLTFQKDAGASRVIFHLSNREQTRYVHLISRACKTLYEATVHRGVERLNPVAAKIFQSVKKLFLHFTCNSSIEEILAVCITFN